MILKKTFYLCQALFNYDNTLPSSGKNRKNNGQVLKAWSLVGLLLLILVDASGTYCLVNLPLYDFIFFFENTRFKVVFNFYSYFHKKVKLSGDIFSFLFKSKIASKNTICTIPRNLNWKTFLLFVGVFLWYHGVKHL